MNKLSDTFNFGKLTFVILSLSLLVGFYLNEDASAGGQAADFYGTWGHILALKENLFINTTSQLTVHFPLHNIILSRLNFIITDRYLLRLLFCIMSISIPLLFYLNLKTKFDFVNKNILWLLAASIFIFPAFRAAAIWANDHITAFFFFLLFTLFFLKWEKKKNYEELNLYLILQVFFLSLAVYCRQYYALIFLYLMLIYFQKLKFKIFFNISLIVFILSLPGFWLITQQTDTLELTFSNKFYNSLLINSSIISFYLIPIFFPLLLNNRKIFINNKKFFITTTSLSILIVFFFSILFDYNFRLGGGFFLKLSILLFENKLLFYLTAIFGFVSLSYLSRENRNNLILFLLLLFGFSSWMIFQKYFEPMLIFIFFLIIDSKLPVEFLKNYRNLLYFYIYIFIYLTSAIINDIFQITKNI